MSAVSTISGLPAPLLRDDIDTDIIIPSREIRAVSKEGLADGLFAGWRYVDGRKPDPRFVLNRKEYEGSPILLSGSNFGCGSSREQAVWALREFGIRAIVATSFNPIFKRNCVRNFVLPAIADSAAIAATRLPVTIDLADRTVRTDAGHCWNFAIDDEAADMLLTGRDEIEYTLAQSGQIEAWRARDREKRPWAYFTMEKR